MGNEILLFGILKEIRTLQDYILDHSLRLINEIREISQSEDGFDFL